jgi:hypothetical protein
MRVQRIAYRTKGLTLLEVLIATTLTLLIMLALTQGFKTLSESISEGRSRLALNDQLRGLIFLLNEDLKLRTTNSQTPQDVLSGTGYFKYLDGGLCDWTTLLANVPADATISGLPTELKKETMLNGGSRWGDVDDILMFTARAKPGEAFRGKIPRALMLIANFNDYTKQNVIRVQNDLPPFVNPPPPLPTTADWLVDLTISSEFAEIVWFTIPVSQLPNGTYSPASIFQATDATGETILGPDGMPKRLALCRRVLLVRPDLDITPPAGMGLRTTDPVDANRLLTMQPTSPFHLRGSNPLAGVRLMEMIGSNAYKRCDLSCSTKLIMADDATNSFLTYKTNSLSDLQDPQNRFAHGVYPMVSSGGTLGATLPVMMLTGGPTAILSSCNYARFLSGHINKNFVPNGGFIPPQFMRVRCRLDSAGVPTESPTLQEFVTLDAVAFDIKAFDASAPVLFHPGADRQWGVAQFDDNNVGGADDNLEAGWPDSDDLTVSPSDPGFWKLLANGTVEESGRGAFVDIGWGFKGMGHPDMLNLANPKPPLVATHTVGEFSGVSVFPNSGIMLPSANLRYSGQLSTPDRYALSMGLTDPDPITTVQEELFVFQNAFDTWTNAYDSDGEQDGRGPYGDPVLKLQYARFFQSGLRRLGYTVTAPLGIFALDPVGGDVTPPYPSELKSIQATIRIQDVGAQTLQQVSIIHALSD